MKLSLVVDSINKESGNITFKYYPTNISVKQLSKAKEIYTLEIKNVQNKNNSLDNLVGRGITIEV